MHIADAQPGVMRLHLRGRDWARTVSVLTDGREPAFPQALRDTGESTGDTELDQAVRSYVREELAARAAERPRPRGRWS